MKDKAAAKAIATRARSGLRSVRRQVRVKAHPAVAHARFGLAQARRVQARPPWRATPRALTDDERWALHEVDRILAERPASAVAVLTRGDDATALTQLLRIGHPHSSVTCVPFRADNPSAHVRLAAAGPFRAIVIPPDVIGDAQDLTWLYRTVLFHLVRGGRLLLPDCDPERPAPHGLVPLLDRLAAVHDEAVEATGGDERVLAAATTDVVKDGRRLVVTNGTAAKVKVREEEIDFILDYRGERAGRVLEHVDAETHQPRGTIIDHADESCRRQLKPISVPRLSLREYRGAICMPRQVTVLDNLLLPDTFRHFPRARMANSRTTELAARFARPQLDVRTARRIKGNVFQWDSEHSGHFGHLMTEQMSRLWAWRSAKARYPDLRVVISRSRDSHPVAPWERGLLEAAGIDPDETIRITGPIRPERVVAATPMFAQPWFVSPRIAEVWDEIGQAAEARAGADRLPERIFVSRRHEARSCHNRDDLERTFVDSGFTIIYPEDMSFADQVAVFRNAEVVAGFAGSGMFTLTLCDKPKRVLLISSEGYTPNNEYLITAVRGHELNVFWSVPDSMEVNAPFAFDFDREGRHLGRLLAD